MFVGTWALSEKPPLLLREFFLYQLVGLASLVSSAAALITGAVEELSIVLGRYRWNWVGVLGSYFLHQNWLHLFSNLSFYAAGVSLIYLLSHRLYFPEKALISKMSSWVWWSVLEFSLMVLIGLVDLCLNPLYGAGGSISIGMSDLVSAVLVSALALLYCGLLGGGFVHQRRLLKIDAWLCAATLSAALILSNTFSALQTGVNIFAHVYGIWISALVWMVLLLVEKKAFAAFLVNYLLILLGIYVVAVVLRA